MSNFDATRVMGTPGAERTLATQAGGATLQMTASGLDPMRTQMGGTTTCSVCSAQTPFPEIYCGECGFLLASVPAESVEVPTDEQPIAVFVDIQDGRRFALKPGLNTVGRQGTDILAPEVTVSRVHARVTVTDGQVIIEDMGSSNGTKVGDRRLAANEPTEATHGMPVRFGSWRVMLEIPGLEARAPEENTATTVLATPRVAGEPDTDAPVGTPIAWLKLQSGPGWDIPLPEGITSLGRRPENTIAMPKDAFMSGRHAELIAEPNGVFLVDVGSTNGTVVNGRKLVANERQLLLEGDDLQIGQSKYVFALAEVPEARASEWEDSGAGDMHAGALLPDGWSAGAEDREGNV